METKYIGDNLIAIRKANKLSQEDVALLLDIDLEKYVSWELGESAPNVAEIILVAKILQVDTVDLVKAPVKVETVQTQSVTAKQNGTYSVEQIVKVKDYTTESRGKTVLKYMILGFTILSMIMMLLPYASVHLYLSNNSTTWIMITLYDFLFTSNFRIGNFFYWIMFLCLVWNIVDMMILLISRSLQNGPFHRVSRILLVVFNVLALLLYVLLSLLFNMELEYGFYFVLISMIALFICVILYAKPSKKKTEKAE